MKKSGVLLHISSLPSRFGIGHAGAEAFRYIDFLEASGQSFWQMLPIGPTGYADSPYQTFCTFAVNPYFIDTDRLIAEGLLSEASFEAIDWGCDPQFVDYGKIYSNFFAAMTEVSERAKDTYAPLIAKFAAKNRSWLHNFAAFMTLKTAHGGAPWYEWETPYRLCQKTETDAFIKEHRKDYDAAVFMQYVAYRDMKDLRAYARKKKISLIGDLPIYVALDSSDVWGNHSQFALDKKRRPTKVAGVPPDYFSATGQLWGNPLYNYKAMQEDGFAWWISRAAKMQELFDVIRIDHFRGFESFWAVPAGAPDATSGKWVKGVGYKLFRAFNEKLKHLDIIAEDLGVITPAVEKLIQKTGYPGMKVMQFAFDGNPDNVYLPHTYPAQCVGYIGTHDNDTLVGAIDADKNLKIAMMDYLKLGKGAQNDTLVDACIRSILSSDAETVILTMQDILHLSTEFRMNTPSVTEGNWRYRLLPEDLTPELAQKLLTMTREADRLPN